MAYDAKKNYYRFDDHLSRLVLDYEASRQISSESESLYHGLPTDPYDEGLFVEHNVKRGLRNADGSGVVAGLTRISDVHGYNKVDGKVVPDQASSRFAATASRIWSTMPRPRIAMATRKSPICLSRVRCPTRKSSTAFASAWAPLDI